MDERARRRHAADAGRAVVGLAQDRDRRRASAGGAESGRGDAEPPTPGAPPPRAARGASRRRAERSARRWRRARPRVSTSNRTPPSGRGTVASVEPVARAARAPGTGRTGSRTLRRRFRPERLRRRRDELRRSREDRPAGKVSFEERAGGGDGDRRAHAGDATIDGDDERRVGLAERHDVGNHAHVAESARRQRRRPLLRRRESHRSAATPDRAPGSRNASSRLKMNST